MQGQENKDGDVGSHLHGRKIPLCPNHAKEEHPKPLSHSLNVVY
jgi:hypothetical protein